METQRSDVSIFINLQCYGEKTVVLYKVFIFFAEHNSLSVIRKPKVAVLQNILKQTDIYSSRILIPCDIRKSHLSGFNHADCIGGIFRPCNKTFLPICRSSCDQPEKMSRFESHFVAADGLNRLPEVLPLVDIVQFLDA